MHHSDRVHHVQEEPLERAQILRLETLAVARIGVCDAFAAWRDRFDLPLIKRFEEDRQCARRRALLDIDQLICGPQLARGNDVPDLRDDHRDGVGH